MTQLVPTSSAVAPAVDEILVVRRRLAVDDATLASMRAVLDGNERARADRYVFESDRRNGVVSRGSLRRLLGTLLARAPEALSFVTGPQGKPSLSDGSIEFNVTHTSEWLQIAVSPGRTLGLDIEGGERNLDVDELAPTVFTPHERAELQGYTNEARHMAFLRGWTRKEAYVKVLGTGLSMPLSDFSVTLSDQQQVGLTTHLEPALAADHVIVDLPAPARHAAALAWSRAAGPVARVLLVELE